MREIDRRIHDLQKCLPTLTVVDHVGNEEQGFFGAWITLETADQDLVEYRTVGGDEIDSDPGRGSISVDSPWPKPGGKKGG